MRLFLGIDLPNHSKQELENIIAPLKKEYPYFSWVPPENYHITVQFLGEQTNKEEVIQLIERSIFELRPFHLYSYAADLFINHKITLFFSFTREKNLEATVKNLQKSFELEDEKKYVSHLTFARYRIPSKQQYYLIKKKTENMNFELDIPVEKLYLYESILSTRTTHYNKISEFTLI